MKRALLLSAWFSAGHSAWPLTAAAAGSLGPAHGSLVIAGGGEHYYFLTPGTQFDLKKRRVP